MANSRSIRRVIASGRCEDRHLHYTYFSFSTTRIVGTGENNNLGRLRFRERLVQVRDLTSSRLAAVRAGKLTVRQEDSE